MSNKTMSLVERMLELPPSYPPKCPKGVLRKGEGQAVRACRGMIYGLTEDEIKVVKGN